jgi:hypothetical protein
VAHGPNHLLFRKDAIDACLSLRDWDDAERHGAALEDFINPYPLPWSTFIIARARALAAYGRGRRDRPLMGELERLRRGNLSSREELIMAQGGG